jgi:methylenetetrahydrofolate reductase (NADPH)
MAAVMTTVEDRADPIDAIAEFMAGFSLEATRPSAEEVAALAAVAPARTSVYISATGEFRSAMEVIDGGALQRRGICEIGVAGYPDGHPRLLQQDLDRALADKIRAAESTGLAVHIVTQFCFDAQAILQWIARLRDFGLEHPVRIGLAGPTNLATLLRYAKRCGVRASAHSLARQAGLVRQLFAMSAPDALVRALAQARAERHLGEIAPHFFSFGGLARTARWAEAVAQRHIAFEAGEGFRVEPPR